MHGVRRFEMNKRELDKYNKWAYTLEVANVDFEESDYWNNKHKIQRNCTTKYSFNFYKERYGFLFDDKVLQHIKDKNVGLIKSKRTNMYDPKQVAKKEKISLEEAERLVKKRKSKTAGTLDNFIERHGEVEGRKKYEAFCQKSSQTLEKYIERYGEKDGRRLYEEYKQSKTNTLDNFVKKYGDEEGLRRFEKWKENYTFSMSLEGHIERYGEEEGRKKYDATNKKKVVDLPAMIEKYGKEEGTRKYQLACLRKSKGQTLQYFQSKYGEEEGRSFYEDMRMKQSTIFQELKKRHGIDKAKSIYRNANSKKYQAARQEVANKLNKAKSPFGRLSKGCTSKSSISFFDKLQAALDRKLQYGRKKDELSLFDEANLKKYFYDCYDEKTNTIIEYHGVAFHPKKGDFDWVNPYGFGYEEIRARDESKEQTALDAGYNYVVVWSDETVHDNIQKVMEALNENQVY